jgi:hypothetical protein
MIRNLSPQILTQSTVTVASDRPAADRSPVRRPALDHSRAPVLEAVADYHRADRYGFTLPGHKQGRGADPRAVEILGIAPFLADMLATSGLDDRSSSGGFVADAQNLMADAVGAHTAFFSSCGSSLSVKAATLAVAGGRGDLLIGRNQRAGPDQRDRRRNGPARPRRPRAGHHPSGP